MGVVIIYWSAPKHCVPGHYEQGGQYAHYATHHTHTHIPHTHTYTANIYCFLSGLVVNILIFSYPLVLEKCP